MTFDPTQNFKFSPVLLNKRMEISASNFLKILYFPTADNYVCRNNKKMNKNQFNAQRSRNNSFRFFASIFVHLYKFINWFFVYFFKTFRIYFLFVSNFLRSCSSHFVCSLVQLSIFNLQSSEAKFLVSISIAFSVRG